MAATHWKDCRYHGRIVKPEIRDVMHMPGCFHLHLYCPECFSFLGYGTHIKVYRTDDEQTQRATYLRFLSEAKAAGWRPGSAYFRFKTRYGIEPDPEWNPAAKQMMPGGVT